MIVSTSASSVVKDVLLVTLACFLTIFMGLACDNHDGEASHHHESSMSSGTFESSNHDMSVKIRVDEVSPGTVDINVEVTEFKFISDTEHRDGIGHAHLYIDGESWGMLYKSETTITELSAGSRVFKVILNTADHRNYAHHGEPITDEVRLIVN
ncbi:MAG: hypothetical protein P8J64_04330 [Dehalococcoidia bacterium]|nr:hypothetical protein [Dehalococcoidia bacterium]